MVGSALAQINLSLQNTQSPIPFTKTSQAQKAINTGQTKFTRLLPENADTYAARRKNYLQRIQDTYKINITYFEQIIEALQNPEFAQLLLKHTLKETFWNRFFSINTSWGQYFAEKTELGIFLEAVLDCQKNQNECEALVPKKIAKEANYQAQILLTEKSNLLTNQKVLEKPSYNNEASPLQKIGPEFQVNTKELGFQTEPAFARFEDGRYIIIWKRNLNSVYSLHGRIFNPDGSPKTSEFLIAPSISDLSKPAVVPFEHNNFAVGFTTDKGTYINPDGTKASKTILIDTHGTSLTAVSLNTHKATFMWYNTIENIVKGVDVYNNGSFGSIYTLPLVTNHELFSMTIINNMLTSINYNDNFIYGKQIDTDKKYINSFIISETPGKNSNEAITEVEDTKLIAVWDNTKTIQGQKLFKDGSRLNAPFVITADIQKNIILRDAKIIKLSKKNRFFVAWRKIQFSLKKSKKKSDIFVQVMEGREKIGPPIKINTNPNEEALNYYMSPLGNNTSIIIWQGEIWPDKSNIRFQILSINGKKNNNNTSSSNPWIYRCIGISAGFTVFIVYIYKTKYKKDIRKSH